MPADQLQDLLDSLLAQACPGWRLPPEMPTASDYDRLETTRLQLGQALAAQPKLTAQLADKILKAILLEYSAFDQLTAPLIAAVGRRTVLEHLIDAVTEGQCQRRAKAASAAYWVRCWRHPQEPSLLRLAFAEGARSPAEFRSYLARHLPPRPDGIDAVDDLWPKFWRACLTAFIECDDPEVRSHLQTAFPNEAECYPREFAGSLQQARQIAAADPERFRRLLNQSTGYGYRI